MRVDIFGEESRPLDFLVESIFGAQGGTGSSTSVSFNVSGRPNHTLHLRGTGMVLDANGRLQGGVIDSIDVIFSWEPMGGSHPPIEETISSISTKEAGGLNLKVSDLRAAHAGQRDAILAITDEWTFGSVANLEPGELLRLLGDDVFAGYNWYVKSGAGKDRLSGDGNVNWLFGQQGDDRLSGGSADDRLFGGSGADVVIGGNGDDHLTGGAGDDRLDGGAGSDWAEFKYNNDLKQIAPYGVSVDLQRGLASGQGNDVFTGIENASGSGRADALYGSAGKNHLDGLEGNDRIDGRSGSDTLAGGRGNDALKGGAGYDTFVFDQPAGTANADRITDFNHATDTIFLGRPFLSIGFPWLKFSADMLLKISGADATPAAVDEEDRIIYMRGTGELYYDRDGSGTEHDPLLFATLINRPAIDASDFRVGYTYDL